MEERYGSPEHICSSGCKAPPEEPQTSWYWRAVWWAWGWITWPWQSRQLRKAGFVRMGWRHWE